MSSYGLEILLGYSGWLLGCCYAVARVLGWLLRHGYGQGRRLRVGRVPHTFYKK